MMNEALARALAFHSQHRLPEAEPLYRQALEKEPESPQALEGLGVVLFQLGRVSEAAEVFARGTAVRPDSALMHANLGEALRLCKRLDAAFESLNKAYRLDPTLFQTYNSLGLLAHDRGQHDEAERAYREALRRRPRFAAGYINLGNTFQARHQRVQAIEAFRTALRIEPDNFIALANLGQVLTEMGKLDLLDEAEDLCRRAVKLAPGMPQVHNNLGNVLRQKGRLDEAMACFQQALKLDPRQQAARGHMGQILQERGQFDEAARVLKGALEIAPNSARSHADYASFFALRGQQDQAVRHYQQAVACDRNFAEAHHGLGVALLEQSRLDEAERYFREALRIDPTLAISWAALARLQAERGDIELSCESARRALAVDSELTEAYWRLAINLREKTPDSEVESMRRLLDAKYLPTANRAMLLFALGAICDGRGQYEQAAAHFESANSLQAAAKKARGTTYDPESHARVVERMIATVSSEFLARRRGWGDPDPRPVFVVGLPRSGTTLTEQILASHPEIEGVGELNDLHTLFGALPELVGQRSLDSFRAVDVLDPNSAKSAARVYLAALDALAPKSARRVVDKMPDNFRLLGLIAVLLPSARVIVCRRDLRDIAISCWQTGFERNTWTNEWENIALRFADYQRMMEHWRRVQPIPYLELSYEHLVSNLEEDARRLIDFVGVQWDPACLEFHSTRRVVRTASLIQVRQPVYTRSVGRWRHYEASIQPLLRACERLGVVVDGS